MKRVLFLATTTGYQVRMFGEAAERLGVRLLFATDRCDQLDDPWWDGAIPVRFHQEGGAVDAIVREAEGVDGVLAVGDRPTVAAAYAALLLGVPGHPPDAARAARDKRLSRERFRAAGLPVPEVQALSRQADPLTTVRSLTFPVVVKPAVLSGSRGVIRANDAAEYLLAFERVKKLLEAPDVRELRDPAADDVLVETYIPGDEYAVEGVIERGVLKTLAIFDKPDPLEGPFFEETLYVTPSRAPSARQDAIIDTMQRACTALGLWHGPIHGECRVNADGVYVLEVAARPIGGLCAQALRFVRGSDCAGLEELLLRHAVGEPLSGWTREPEASGVMMIPIPGSGIYRGATGVDEAGQVPDVWDVRITAKADQRLVPLPEGASYLGFIFARASSAAAVEAALRAAHARLEFRIDPALPMVSG